jgi:hypothetical protein
MRFLLMWTHVADGARPLNLERLGSGLSDSDSERVKVMRNVGQGPVDPF